MQALISVSDKTGIIDFARALAALGVELLSTGGSARVLIEAGLTVTQVAQRTGFPELLDGRVKTLHPAIHAGLLARRDVPEHLAALAAHGIATIELLIVDLYPFEACVARADCTLDDAIEQIDIGGPALLRSAAKNWRDVAVLSEASQYAGVLAELHEAGSVSAATRFALAVAAFNRVSNYDAAISDYLSALQPDGAGGYTRAEFPAQANARFVKLQDLRYGENPHQRAALYRDLQPAPGALVSARQLQGKELSYNNLADADAAWECVKAFASPHGPVDAAAEPGTVCAACVIIKHANPCGVALGRDAAEAYGKAFKTDPTSAFGGVIAFNVEVDAAAAGQLGHQFVEVLIAPSFTPGALALLAARPKLRVLQLALPPGGTTPRQQGRNAHDFKRIGSGLLVQSADNHRVEIAELKVATIRQPSAEQMADLLFAWAVAKYVKSNAIVFCGGGMTLGVGAGQMSRVDSARIAAIKAQNAGLSLRDSVVASDAFFPFRDGLDVVVDAGAACVIQPGGSVRDGEVIAAADERGVAMVLTGVRHFRH